MPYAASGPAAIYYETHGDGPALAFAHGRGGNAASWWQQVPVFAQRYKVVVFDHRCFGRSACPSEAFDREQFDADLCAVLDAEGIERTAIVCQSMGGWTGLRMALRHPDRVSCLVLSNTPGGVDTPAVRDALTQARAEFAAKGVGSAAVAEDFPDRAPEAAFLYTQITGLNLQASEALEHGGPAWVAVEELQQLAIPTLFVTSDQDQLFPPAVIEEIAAAAPGAELAVLTGAGHSPYFEIPERFNETIAPFLEQHTS